MALRKLYSLSTATLNPSGMTNLLPGGAGVQNVGAQTQPGISAPWLEQEQRDVLDVTATNLLVGTTTPATPAASGKLLVSDPISGAFGARWKLNSTAKQAVARGQYGVVFVPGNAGEAGSAVATSAGNEASTGTKATVVTEGPVQAYVQGTVGGVAISAGSPLAADGAGNFTYAGASPAVGTVLATYADTPVASTVSAPVLRNVYVGGY